MGVAIEKCREMFAALMAAVLDWGSKTRVNLNDHSLRETRELDSRNRNGKDGREGLIMVIECS